MKINALEIRENREIWVEVSENSNNCIVATFSPKEPENRCLRDYLELDYTELKSLVNVLTTAIYRLEKRR